MAIEQATRNQAASRKWRQERSCRVTASRFGEVMNMRATTDGSRLAASIARNLLRQRIRRPSACLHLDSKCAPAMQLNRT